MSRITLMTALAAGLTLAGCGGGGEAGGQTGSEALRAVPASALTSPRAYSDFIGALPVDDSGNGLSVDGVLPPVSETAEPITLS